jgi:hypothetical protein
MNGTCRKIIHMVSVGRDLTVFLQVEKERAVLSEYQIHSKIKNLSSL